MRYVYLHIGRGKTGTTLIQHKLSQARKSLRAQNIHYIKAGDDGGGGHQQFAKSFLHGLHGNRLPAHKPEQVRRRIAREIRRSSADHFLLSSENLCLAVPDDVIRFFDELNQNLQVRIIYFVRSQDETAESEYNQVVKMIGETCSFQTYLDEKLEGYDYNIVAQNWAKCIGKENVICAIYDAAGKDVWDRFISLIPQIDDSKLPSIGSSKKRNAGTNGNRSLGTKAIHLLRILNGIELSKRADIYAEIVDALTGDDIAALFFSSAQAREFRALFESSNRAFSREFLTEEVADLGGRRYSDVERDAILEQVNSVHQSLDNKPRGNGYSPPVTRST